MLMLMFLAMTGMLPIFQSWHVWKGTSKAVYHLFSPTMMLAFTKGAEVIFESFPNAAIQWIAMLSLNRSDISTFQIAGCCSSSPLLPRTRSATAISALLGVTLTKRPR